MQTQNIPIKRRGSQGVEKWKLKCHQIIFFLAHSDMPIIMHVSVSTEARVGTRQGMLSKEMGTQNGKLLKYWLIPL